MVRYRRNDYERTAVRNCSINLLSMSRRVGQRIEDSGSGRELRERGYEQDVQYCSQVVDTHPVVPILQDNHFISY